MKQSVNLLPYHEIPPRDWLSFNSISTVLAGVLLVLGITGAVLEWRYAEVAQTLTDKQQQANRLQQEAQALEAAFARRNDNPVIIEQQQRLEQELAMKQRLIKAIEQLHTRHNQGFSVYLAALSETDTPQTWLTDIRINAPQSQISLSGQTLTPASVPDLLGALSRQPGLKGFSFAELSLEAVTDTEAHRFVAQGARYTGKGETQ